MSRARKPKRIVVELDDTWDLSLLLIAIRNAALPYFDRVELDDAARKRLAELHGRLCDAYPKRG